MQMKCSSEREIWYSPFYRLDRIILIFRINLVRISEFQKLVMACDVVAEMQMKIRKILKTRKIVRRADEKDLHITTYMWLG